MTYDTTIGQNAKYNFNGKQSVKMNTGFVNENYNELIQDLMLSERKRVFEIYQVKDW